MRRECHEREAYDSDSPLLFLFVPMHVDVHNVRAIPDHPILIYVERFVTTTDA